MKIHHYADSLATATPRDVAVSDETLAKLAKVSSGSLTTQLFKHGYRQPALVGLRALNKHDAFRTNNAIKLKSLSYDGFSWQGPWNIPACSIV